MLQRLHRSPGIRDEIDWMIENQPTDCMPTPNWSGKPGYRRANRARLWIITEFFLGPKPQGIIHAAHACGCADIGCHNGAHLRWATAAENTFDATRHRAEDSSLGDLDRATIQVSDLSEMELAELLGTNQGAVARFRHGLNTP